MDTQYEDQIQELREEAQKSSIDVGDLLDNLPLEQTDYDFDHIASSPSSVNNPRSSSIVPIDRMVTFQLESAQSLEEIKSYEKRYAMLCISD